MPTLEADRFDSIVTDSIVTDSPYGLSFMGKHWDHGVPGSAFWKEALRVAKPGAYLLAFGGTRTYHRLTCAIEDAGWEIRDCVMWVYGSGFPKSLDISKALDKAGGLSPKEQAALLKSRREALGYSREYVANWCGSTVSSVRDWEEGRSRREGSPLEYMVPSEAYRAKLADLLGYTSDERILVGLSQDRRGDGSTYGLGHSGEMRKGGVTEAAMQWSGWGTGLKPAYEPIIVARKPLIGTVVQNVLQYGTGGLNIDASRIPTEESLNGGAYAANPQRSGLHGDERTESGQGMFAPGSKAGEYTQPSGRWPANLIHDGSEEVVELFPFSVSGAHTGNYAYRGTAKRNALGPGLKPLVEKRAGSRGSAARFFYCAKASQSDRDEGLEAFELKPSYMVENGSKTAGAANGIRYERTTTMRNNHPTVKPTALMEYLIRLVTPPGGTVFDPFMGSGSTGKAALRAGFNFEGVEMEEEYHRIAEARCKAAMPPEQRLEF